MGAGTSMDVSWLARSSRAGAAGTRSRDHVVVRHGNVGGPWGVVLADGAQRTAAVFWRGRLSTVRAAVDRRGAFSEKRVAGDDDVADQRQVAFEVPGQRGDFQVPGTRVGEGVVDDEPPVAFEATLHRMVGWGA